MKNTLCNNERRGIVKNRRRRESFTGLYHVVVKGINKERIFDQQREKVYLKKIILEFKEKYGIEIYAYCIMSNHAHFIIRAELNELSSFMARVLAKYAFYYNFKHNRNGHVFQNRFMSECIESESYYWTCLRYIHLNPVKANMVKRVVRYKYSSMGEYFTETKGLICENAFEMYKKHFQTYNDFEEFHEFSYIHNQIFQDITSEVEEQRREEALNLAKELFANKELLLLSQIFEEKENREEYIQQIRQTLKVSMRKARDICIMVKNQVNNG